MKLYGFKKYRTHEGQIAYFKPKSLNKEEGLFWCIFPKDISKTIFKNPASFSNWTPQSLGYFPSLSICEKIKEIIKILRW